MPASHPAKPIVVILMGVSGSGKTTIGKRLAADLGWSFHDADDEHSISNLEKMHRGIPLTEADRQPWLRRLAHRIHQWFAAQQNTVLACSALTHAARQQLKAGDDRVQFVYLKGSFELIHRRMANRRGHFMPAELLEDQFQILEEPHDAIEIDASDDPGTIVKNIRQRLAE